MKLSDRLTRAGLVFILLGATAALLPEDGLALACPGPCPPPAPKCIYELKSSDCSHLLNGNTYTFSRCPADVIFTPYKSCDNGTCTNVTIKSCKLTPSCGNVSVCNYVSYIKFTVTKRPLSATVIITFSDGGTETIYLRG